MSNFIASKTSAFLLMLIQANVGSSSSVNAAGRNAVVTSLMVCCGYIICWTPNGIYTFMMVINYITTIHSLFYNIIATMAFMNSCINPFIYAAKYRDFQAGVRRMLRKQVEPSA